MRKLEVIYTDILIYLGMIFHEIASGHSKKRFSTSRNFQNEHKFLSVDSFFEDIFLKECFFCLFLNFII